MDNIEVIFEGNKIKVSIGDKYNRLKILNIFREDNVVCCKCECECGNIIERILYIIWADIRRRCRGNNRKDSKNYCAKGIKVCDEWEDFNNFKNWALNNGYKDDLTIERKDNNKNYCPDNCCWIPKKEQSKNRTSNHYITFEGETKTLSDWAITIGISRTTLQSRLKRGWTIEDALKTPIKK